MKHITLLIVALLLLGYYQTSAQTLDAGTVAKLSEYFAQEHRNRLKALENGNIPAAVTAYADDAYLLEIGAALKVKEAISKHLDMILTSMEIKNTKNEQKEVNISGDLAYDYGTTTMDLHYTFNEAVQSVKSKYIAIWKKNEAGDWKIIKLIFNQE